MKSAEYVNRFASGIAECGKAAEKAIEELWFAIAADYNSQVRAQHVHSQQGADKLAHEFNIRRGRVIADMINTKIGRNAINREFFIEGYKICRKAEGNP